MPGNIRMHIFTSIIDLTVDCFWGHKGLLQEINLLLQ